MFELRQLYADSVVIPKEKEINKIKFQNIRVTYILCYLKLQNMCAFMEEQMYNQGMAGLPDFEGQGFPEGSQVKITTRSWPEKGRSGCL